MNRKPRGAIRGGLALSAVVLLGAALICKVPAAQAADYVVIANPSVPGNSISKEILKSIFLGDKTTWNDGKPIKIVLLDGGPVHKLFVEKLIGKTATQFDSYWKKLIFTGKAGTPKTFENMQKAMEFVAGEPGAIGYVAPGVADKSVKTLNLE